jgi:hypothetical protein
VSGYQRPWWLWVNKPGAFTTTVQEEATPQGQRYTIRAEPVIHSLAWLVWGPLAGLGIIILLTGLAIGLQVREQSLTVRALFVLAFLGLPALIWIATVVGVNRLAARHLGAEREAEAQSAQLRLDPAAGVLYYRANSTAPEMALPFERIKAVKVTEPIGARYSSAVCLALETDQGKVILLNETLGTEAQKFDLAREIQTAMQLAGER